MSGLLITGMHHSGTSLVAGLLSAFGWHSGEDLIPDDPYTGKKFHEDAALVAINRAWFAESVSPGSGHADWGITNGRSPDLASVSGGTDLARAFCKTRNRRHRVWLSKDPRLSLTLPLWTNLPATRFVIVYRSPWDVVTSIMKIEWPFCGDPDWIREAWTIYNRSLLTHIMTNRSECLLVSAEAVVEDPAGFVELVAEWTGDSRKLRMRREIRDVLRPDLFACRGTGTPIAGLYQDLYPQLTSVVEELDALAHLPRSKTQSWTSLVVPAGTLAKGTGLQVVIPCKEDGAFLDESIASVEASTEAQDFGVELTVVDDHSKGTTSQNVLKNLQLAGYQVVANRGSGLSAARNTGFNLSQTATLLPLDADNRVCRSLIMSTAQIAAGTTDVIHGQWQRFGMNTLFVDPPEVTGFQSFFPDNTIDACALISRSLFDRIGGYEERIPFLEDWEFWMRALSAGARFHKVDQLSFFYLVRPNSLVASIHQRPREYARVYDLFISRFGSFLEAGGIGTTEWERRIKQLRASEAASEDASDAYENRRRRI